MGQKTSRKNVKSNVLIFSSFMSFLMYVMGGKNHNKLKTALKYKQKRNTCISEKKLRRTK